MGRLIVPGHYETPFRSDGVKSDIVYYSDDGETWTVTETALPLMDEDTLTEIGNNGDIMINMRTTNTSRNRAVAISKDGGKSFGNITFDD